MSYPIHAKSNEKLPENNWRKTSKQQKKIFKITSKPSYMSHKIFGYNLVLIRKSCINVKQTCITQNVYFGIE